MPAGSHKDAFKAHQKVKRIFNKDGVNRLPKMAADILLDFVKNQRQINRETMPDTIPTDDERYDRVQVSEALTAVDGLCGKCNESHDDACFVNQVRRVLIAVMTGVDLGPAFDGRSELKDLLAMAEKLSTSARPASADEAARAPEPQTVPDGADADEVSRLRQQIEEAKEREIFRDTLIDEIVATITSVTGGNYASTMPVHDDPRLGKLATAFNLMLDNVNRTMARLDDLIRERSAEMRRIMDNVDKGILTVDRELRIGPEYSACCRRLFATDNLRGQNLLEVLGLVGRSSAAGEQVRDFTNLYFSQLLPDKDIDPLNPIPELELAHPQTGEKCWVAFRFFPMRDAGQVARLMIEATDISQQKRLRAEIDAANVHNAQVSAIASDLDLFQAFVAETQQILNKVDEELVRFRSGTDPRDAARELFRGVHTVKGTAAAFKLAELVEETGKLETFLSPLRQSVTTTPENVTVLSEGLISVRKVFNAVVEIARPILGHALDEGAGTSLRIPAALVERLLEKAGPLLANAGTEGRQALTLLTSLYELPARKAFARSVKAIQPLAERLDKKIRLTFTGEETPIPVPAAAPLDSALMHILRNACDHGIESPDRRMDAGKAEEGVIELNCHAEDDRLTITVRDDGGGIDPVRVTQSAIEKGLISAEQALTLSEHEKYRLLVTPGFSTRAEASDVSGRGVGLDVAVAEVENSLGGKLEIESVPGHGTVMRMSVPRQR